MRPTRICHLQRCESNAPVRKPLGRVDQDGLGGADLVQTEVVLRQVDRRVDLRVAELRGPAEIERLPVQVDRVPQVAELLVQPSGGVHAPRDAVLVLALAALLTHLVEELEGQVPFAQPCVGVAEEAERNELVESLVTRLGEPCCLSPVLERRAILAAPARVSAQPREIGDQRAGEAPPAADLDGAEQLRVRLPELPGLLVHHAERVEAARQDPLVARLVGDHHGLSGALLHVALVGLGEPPPVGAGLVAEGLALLDPVAEPRRRLLHRLEVGHRLVVARHEVPDEPPRLVDRHQVRVARGRAHPGRGLERLGVEVDRLPVGEDRPGTVPRASRVRERLRPHLPMREVMGELGDVLVEPVGVQRLDRASHELVKRAAPRLEKAPVRHVLDEGVLEDVLQVREERLLVDELEGAQVGERFIEAALDVGDPAQEVRAELPADHGGRLDRALPRVGEPVDPAP